MLVDDGRWDDVCSMRRVRCGAMFTGHAHPRLDAAVRRQLDRVAHVTGLGMSHPTSICLAKRLTELAPPGLEHVFFSSDGLRPLKPP